MYFPKDKALKQMLTWVALNRGLVMLGSNGTNYDIEIRSFLSVYPRNERYFWLVLDGNRATHLWEIPKDKPIYDTIVTSRIDIKDLKYLTDSPRGDISRVNDFHSMYQISDVSPLEIDHRVVILKGTFFVVEVWALHLSSALILTLFQPK